MLKLGSPRFEHVQHLIGTTQWLSFKSHLGYRPLTCKLGTPVQHFKFYYTKVPIYS